MGLSSTKRHGDFIQLEQHSGKSPTDWVSFKVSSATLASSLPEGLPDLSVATYLQLGPLDPAHTPRGIPPGMLGAIDELGVLELVGAGAFDFLVHLLQPVHVGLGAKPKKEWRGEWQGELQWDGLEVFCVCVCMHV